MNNSFFIRFLAFYASYWPLYIIFFIGYFDFNKLLSLVNLYILILILIGMVSLTFFTIFIHDKRKFERTALVENIRREKGLSIDYVLTLILPFIAFQINQTRDFICFLVLWGVLGSLYAKYNLLKYNIFDFIGYTFYTVDLYAPNKDGSKTIIAKDQMVIAKLHKIRRLENYEHYEILYCDVSDDLRLLRLKK